MYVHLHWHSHYSLLEAIGKPKNLVREAKDYGMTALALTDYNGLFWAIEFYKACKDAQIKPIIGVELWYVYDISTRDKNETCGNIVLLAKNYTGYQQLLKIVSEANLHGRNNGKARIDHALLSKYADGLMILISGMESHAAKQITNNEDSAKISEEIGMLATHVGKENIIIEIAVQDESIYPDIKKINTTLAKLATNWGYTLTCANNYHYIDEADQKVSEVALAIKDGKRMFDDDRRKVTMQQHIMNEEEIRQILVDNGYESVTIDQMIQNTQTIADSIQLDIPMDTILFPKYESPDHIKELYEKHKDGLIVS